jgi:hypothetical protein
VDARWLRLTIRAAGHCERVMSEALQGQLQDEPETFQRCAATGSLAWS